MGADANISESKLNELLDYNGMKTDKHMRDTEALMHSRFVEPVEK